MDTTTNTPLEDQKKQLIFNRLSNHISKAERKIAELTKEMNETYAYFFEWHADEMLQTQLELKDFKMVHTHIDYENRSLEQIKTLLQGHIEYLTDDLLEGRIISHSTSQMTNMAHSIGLVAKQSLLRTYQSIYNSINS